MAQEHSDKSAASSIDTELSRMVVEQRLATQEEVDHCRAVRSQGSGETTLAHVLVNEGMVTQRQIARVKTTIEASRGQQIPGYQILAKLGSGAMATVFKARQLSLDRIVAIKVLPKKLSENLEYVERFHKEGKAAAKLNHANIVQAIDVGEAGGYHYFVMEYVEGHTLGDELAEGQAFSEAEALRITIQIGRALEHAHRQGLMHRDVKPKNIMMTPEGVAKLADMGLARAASDVQAAQAEAGRAYGTPYYISPEQIRGELKIGPQADLYSLGATFYHMVTGRVPFEGKNPSAVMHKHLKTELIPPDHVNPKLSAGCAQVIEMMMTKDPSDRYQTAADLIVDLERISRGEAPHFARQALDHTQFTAALTDEVAMPPTVKEEPPREPRLIDSPVFTGVLIILAFSVLVNLILLIVIFSTG
jgi:serine/threonine protein kinase